MLRLLRRILGWDANSGPFDFECLEQTTRPPSSTAEVLTQKPKPVVQPPAGEPGKKPVKSAKPEQKKAAKQPREKTPEEILSNPELSLNGPQDEGFDPYNTGAFNRSASWEKIAKHRANR